MTDPCRSALQTITANWRIEADDAVQRGYIETSNTLHSCANELDALLVQLDGLPQQQEGEATRVDGDNG